MAVARGSKRCLFSICGVYPALVAHLPAATTCVQQDLVPVRRMQDIGRLEFVRLHVIRAQGCVVPWSEVLGPDLCPWQNRLH